MKRNLSIVILLALSWWIDVSASAAQVGRNQALTAVETFVRARYPAKRAAVAKPAAVRDASSLTVRAVEEVKSNDAVVGYVVHLAPSGYVLMRADDDAPPVKLYTDAGSFNNLPPNLLAVLKLELSEELATLVSLRKTNGPVNVKFSRQWSALRDPTHAFQELQDSFTSAAGTVLLTTEWDQGDPYNYYAPNLPGGGRAWAGCVATAAEIY